MNLLFYTDAPAADALFLKNGLIYSSGQPLGPACRTLVRDPELAQSCSALFIPLCPSLEEVCAAYLLSAASKLSAYCYDLMCRHRYPSFG